LRYRNLVKKGASMNAIPKKWSMPKRTYSVLEINKVISVSTMPNPNIFKPRMRNDVIFFDLASAIASDTPARNIKVPPPPANHNQYK